MVVHHTFLHGHVLVPKVLYVLELVLVQIHQIHMSHSLVVTWMQVMSTSGVHKFLDYSQKISESHGLPLLQHIQYYPLCDFSCQSHTVKSVWQTDCTGFLLGLSQSSSTLPCNTPILSYHLVCDSDQVQELPASHEAFFNIGSILELVAHIHS